VRAVAHVQTILADSQHIGLPFREITRRVLGNGLITSEDDDWLARRRHVQAAFSTASVHAHGALMVHPAAGVAERFADGQVIDAHDAMVDLTTEVVGEALFGVALSGGIRSEIRTALIVITAHLLARVTRPIALPGWIPTRATLRDRRAARTLHRMAAAIVARARDAGRARLFDVVAAGGEHEVRDQIVSSCWPGWRGPR
jgi:cytochrome P450